MPFNFAKGHPNESLVPTQEIKELLQDLSLIDTNNNNNESILSKALNYGPDEGSHDFRRQLLDFLKRQCGEDDTVIDAHPSSVARIIMTPDNFFQTCGVSHGLELVLSTVAQRGDVVWVEQPTYYLVSAILKSHGLQIEAMPTTTTNSTAMKNDCGSVSIDLDLLETELSIGTRRPPRVVYVIPTHQNPTGRTLTLQERQRLINMAHQYKFLIMADEVYHLLDWGKPEGESSRPARMSIIEPTIQTRTVTKESSGNTPSKSFFGCCSISSFTKIFGPGVRCGWIEGSKDLIHAVAQCGYIQSQGGVGPLMGLMMQRSLELRQVDRVCAHLSACYGRRAAIVYNVLAEEPDIVVPHRPTGGYFMWLQFPFASRAFLDYCQPQLMFMLGEQCCAIDRTKDNNEPPHQQLLSQSVRLCFAYMDLKDLKEASILLVSQFREYRRSGPNTS